ncbi:MAG: DegV family protein [Chloroflexi bacterium]|nr:DegV family protein [Chloroflexota bacterium]OQB00741.1 MAG: DegV domain-containing protein [Chloroflexi bacterium ADurb.Bin222]HOC21077.1 DegV family protein [Anaerolineae bacterium]HQM14071.1 DegV family protein [Anaerolineae bacterium]
MGHIAIVTDSTADLTPELIETHEISIIPLKIQWGKDAYVDGVTLDIPTFYRMLQERQDFPMTSQPSAGEFITFFRQVAERYHADTIVGIFISTLLSGTLTSAAQAKEALPELRIELHDSRSISMGIGFQVLAAARASKKGASVEDVLLAASRVRTRMELLFTVDTLEYLHRGGRIGGATRLLGTLLNFKPLLMVEGGKIDAWGKARSRRKSLEALVTEAQRRLAGRRPVELGVIHTPEDPDAEMLTSLVMDQLQPQRLYTGLISPVLGTHGGPGSIGLVFYTESDDVAFTVDA